MKLNLVGIAVVLGVTACAPSIKYSSTSVPEEGSIRFTRITSDEDQAVGPMIQESKEFGRRYFVSSVFDVSPDGQTLAYIANRAGKTNVFLKSTQGGAATTQRTFRDRIDDVAFSKDGERLAFSDLRNERWNIYEIHARTGSAIKQITNFDQTSRYPTYSPSESNLVYVQFENSSVNGGTAGPATRFYVWGYDLEKGAHTQYAEGYAPAFSPDGKTLAITRNSREHRNSEIWVVDLATGEETLVASSPKNGYAQPSFSPDGKTLVFTGVTMKDGNRPTNFDIYTVRVDGTNFMQMTFHPGDDFVGRFSPDGRSIYFVSERGSDRRKYNVWRMDLR
jgi:Tol biopolymer transport system component